ncbi:hypothetical protein DERF_008995 [Dermatophagoides farinae]|uniref:Uncharacterized protein n=1 Tax=Dermatophagoides farinae TaxID=6954 RepID=A0A922L3K6_DERFA|nr:hypothetical protein DERF_008995 [Dermatophagoides farinae]
MYIKQLDPQTIRRISSGQVIASMSSALKELIENALDASATSIVIRFIEQGKDSIEVIDNGCGIDADNFDLLCRRNCTSKLLEFDQLNNVCTYGFRGQALNSLCNLCELQIHTRHSNQQIGTMIRFDTNGEIIGRENCAREIGTTVTLANLFKPLPVRRKELCQNLRRSFDRTLAMIYQYCVGIIGFRLSCWHHRSGSYEIIFNNNGQSIQSNIVSIFNYKQFLNLMPFIVDEDAIESGQNQVQIIGYISKPDKGCGRSVHDRQYFYINNRPCDLPQLSRQINQMYRQYNRNQYPFVVLRIDTDSQLLDLNCTPDKRTILLANQQYLTRLIVRSLIRMFNRDTNDVLMMNQTQTQIRSFLSTDPSTAKCSTPIKPNNHNDGQELSAISQIPPIKKPELILIPEPPSQTATEFKHPFFESLKITSSLIVDIPSIKQPKIKSNVRMNSPSKTADIQHERKKRKQESTTTNDTKIVIINEVEEDESSRNEIIVDVTIDSICNGYRRGGKISNQKQHCSTENQGGTRVRIAKELFGKARIVGQYNLGFIVVRYDDNLFVLDQHALDERFNYEKLLSNPPITRQRMVVAKSLKLSTASEMLLLDNMEIFQRFGFDFLVDYDRPIGHRVQMTQIPMANRWTANESDVEELIATLIDTPSLVVVNNTTVESNYSRFMFRGLKREIASKACRSSIMIGDFLTRLQMKMLIAKMIDVRNPWHCAHNRPAIRHLISISNFPPL